MNLEHSFVITGWIYKTRYRALDIAELSAMCIICKDDNGCMDTGNIGPNARS